MRIVSVLLFLVIIAAPIAGHSDDRLKLAVSINPLAGILRELVGDTAEISTVVDAKVDPHMFELRPATLRTLSRADLFFMIGLGFEFWAKELPSELELKTVNLSHELGLQGGNPHIWLDPQMALRIANVIKQKLCAIKEKECGGYEVALRSFNGKIANLEGFIRERISKWHQKSFISYHPAWGLFANSFGLTEVGSLRQGHSSDISIKDLKVLIDLARAKEVAVFFMEPGVEVSQVQNLLKESKLRSVVVDDLGRTGEGYFDLMRRDVEAMDRVMRD